MRMRKIKMSWPAPAVTVAPAEPEPTQAQLKAIASESHKGLRGRAWLSLNSSTAVAANMTMGQLERSPRSSADPSSVSCKFNSISGRSDREHFWKRGCRGRAGKFRNRSTSPARSSESKKGPSRENVNGL